MLPLESSIASLPLVPALSEGTLESILSVGEACHKSSVKKA